MTEASQEPPEVPEGMVLLGDLMNEIDPNGDRCDVLAKRAYKTVKGNHPLIMMEALVMALINHINRAPEELRTTLARQCSYQLNEYFKRYMQ